MIINKYKAQPQVCPDMSGMPIEFANCFTAFLCLIGGLALALALLFLENIFKPFENFFRKTGMIAERKVDLQSMDRTQLEFTVNEQRKTITRMKSLIAMNQKIRNRARMENLMYNSLLSNHKN